MDTPEISPSNVAQLAEALRRLLGSDAGFYPSQIEKKYPRILAQIVSLWGTSALDQYLSGLMVSDRPDRHGFEHDVAMEILHLSSIHEALGHSSEKSGTGWSGIQDAEQFRKALTKDNE